MELKYIYAKCQDIVFSFYLFILYYLSLTSNFKMKLVRLSNAWLSLLNSGRKTKKYCVSCGNILYAIGNVPKGRLNKSMNGMDVVVNMLVWGCCVDCRLHGIISILSSLWISLKMCIAAIIVAGLQRTPPRNANSLSLKPIST